MTINYTLGGTATNGDDYQFTPDATVTFAAGSGITTLGLLVNNDTVAEPTETLVLTVADGAGYTAGLASVATFFILDDEAPVLMVGAGDAIAGEPLSGQGQGTFGFGRIGSLANLLTVNFTVGGTATSGVDYSALGTTVTLGPGQPAVNKTVNVIDDTLIEGDETVTVTLATGAGYTVGNPFSGTVTIKDDDAPIVTVVATDLTAAEPGGTGTFTFSRTGSTAAPLTVNFTVSGSATSGVDYTAIDPTVTFAAGSTTATQTVSVMDDALIEGLEDVVVTLEAGAGYTAGSPSSDFVAIIDDDAPMVTVVATDHTAAEPAGTGTFTFSRTGSTATALTVNYAVTGSATSGVDYIPIGTTVTFAVGSTTATQAVSVMDDALIEGLEDVVVTLANGAGYTVGIPTSDFVAIIDDDASIVTVVATDLTAAEPAGTGTFTFSRTGSAATALTVNYTVNGTATSGSDYTAIGTTVTFAPGSPTAIRTVNVLDEALIEGNETVIVTLAAGTEYTVGSPSFATVTIQDDDTPNVTVVATDDVAEEGWLGGKLVFSRTGSTALGLTVNYTVDGTALSGVDYDAIGTTLTFSAGSATANLFVNAIRDALLEGDETVIITLVGSSDYTVGSPFTDTVTIQDAGFSKVTVEKTDFDAGESETGLGSGSLTFTRRGFASIDGPLTVNFTVGGTATSDADYKSLGTAITIPAGTSSVDQIVEVLDDALVEKRETVVVTLVPGAGYTVDSPSTATLDIYDGDTSIVKVEGDIGAAEPDGSRDFTFTRTGPTSRALTVNYTVNGSAKIGSDYKAIGTKVTFAAGSKTATKTVQVLDDAEYEPENENVFLVLSFGEGYERDPLYYHASVWITDDERIVSVAATDGIAEERRTGQVTGTFTFSRSGSTAETLTVNYSVSGTATSGVDYDAIGTTVTFAAGSAIATKTVSVIDDNLVEGSEDVRVALVSGEDYKVASFSGVSVTIQDDDAVPAPPTIVSQPTNVTVGAGKNASFTVAATGTDPLSYQWLKNGLLIANETRDRLQLRKVAATDAGTYSVVVSNAAGSVTSVGAVLVVTP